MQQEKDMHFLSLADFDELPDMLLQARRYILWRLVPNKDPSKKPRKVPFYNNGKPRFGHLDSDIDRAMLVSLSEIIETFNAAQFARPYAGIGFCLGPDGNGGAWLGIDFDNISQRPHLQYLGEQLVTYCEWSPSGNGKHFIGYGRVFAALAPNDTGIEAYSHGRYFTLTGNAICSADPSDFSDFVEKTLRPIHSPEKPEAQRRMRESVTYAGPVPDDTLADLRTALKFIDADDYGVWIETGLALKTLGEAGKDLWLDWSETSGKFDIEEAEEKWEDFQPKHTDYKNVFTVAMAKGWKNAPRFDVRIGTLPKQDTPAASKTDDKNEKKTDELDAALTPALISERELDIANLTPRIIVPGLLFADVRVFIAEGGIGKTTLTLYEMMRLALGLSVWGFQPDGPKKSLMVSREDTREYLVARLREICRAACLSPQDIKQVLQHATIIDLSGINFRLSCIVEDMVCPWTGNINALIERCAAFAPDWLIFDPAVSFGVGEARVNDAEQGLIEAGRMIRNALDCATQLIHHTGKQNARDKSEDQYSGRGGSAMADGARMVAVMTSPDLKDWREATGFDLGDDEKGYKLAFPKISYCVPPEPVYVVRRGFAFEQISRRAVDAAIKLEIQAKQVLQFLRNELSEGRTYSKRSLRDSAKVMNLAQLEVIAALAWLEARSLFSIQRNSLNEQRIIPNVQNDI